MGNVFQSVVYGISQYILQLRIWLPISLVLLLAGAGYQLLLKFVSMDSEVIQIILHLLFSLILIYFIIGIAQISIGINRNDQVHSNFSTLFTPLEVLWEPMALLILLSIMLYFGSIVILPAVIIWVLFQFGLWYNLDKDTQIITSFRLSMISLKKHFIKVLLLDSYICVLVLTGYFLVFLLPVSIPVAVLTLTHFYYNTLNGIEC